MCNYTLIRSYNEANIKLTQNNPKTELWWDLYFYHPQNEITLGVAQSTIIVLMYSYTNTMSEWAQSHHSQLFTELVVASLNRKL